MNTHTSTFDVKKLFYIGIALLGIAMIVLQLIQGDILGRRLLNHFFDVAYRTSPAITKGFAYVAIFNYKFLSILVSLAMAAFFVILAVSDDPGEEMSTFARLLAILLAVQFFLSMIFSYQVFYIIQQGLTDGFRSILQYLAQILRMLIGTGAIILYLSAFLQSQSDDVHNKLTSIKGIFMIVLVLAAIMVIWLVVFYLLHNFHITTLLYQLQLGFFAVLAAIHLDRVNKIQNN